MKINNIAIFTGVFEILGVFSHPVRLLEWAHLELIWTWVTFMWQSWATRRWILFYPSAWCSAEICFYSDYSPELYTIFKKDIVGVVDASYSLKIFFWDYIFSVLWRLHLDKLGSREKVTVKCVSVGKPSPGLKHMLLQKPAGVWLMTVKDLCAWTEMCKHSTSYCVTPQIIMLLPGYDVTQSWAWFYWHVHAAIKKERRGDRRHRLHTEKIHLLPGIRVISFVSRVTPERANVDRLW